MVGIEMATGPFGLAIGYVSHIRTIDVATGWLDLLLDTAYLLQW